jgi:hypothetical protein
MNSLNLKFSLAQPYHDPKWRYDINLTISKLQSNFEQRCPVCKQECLCFPFFLFYLIHWNKWSTVTIHLSEGFTINFIYCPHNGLTAAFFGAYVILILLYRTRLYFRRGKYEFFYFRPFLGTIL